MRRERQSEPPSLPAPELSRLPKLRHKRVPMMITEINTPLTERELFRLIMVAHESPYHALREAALTLLQRSMCPVAPVQVRGEIDPNFGNTWPEAQKKAG